jgi:hypothetical protein
MLLLLSLCVVLVEAQIQVPDCLPAAKANWNWVRVPFTVLCDRSMTLWIANRHTTPSSRPLVQQPATWPQNAAMAVRPLSSLIPRVNLMNGVQVSRSRNLLQEITTQAQLLTTSANVTVYCIQ